MNNNINGVYKTLGASNHTKEDREINDFYATDPISIDLLCEVEKFTDTVWECSAGNGHMSKRLIKNGYNVYSTDLLQREYNLNKIIDFLKITKKTNLDIITNPPYRQAYNFIEKAIELLRNKGKLALFLKVQFLEGKKRKILFKKYPPKIIYVSSSRILCAKNGNFEIAKKHGGSAIAYAWYIWEKGYIGNTILKWIN